MLVSDAFRKLLLAVAEKGDTAPGCTTYMWGAKKDMWRKGEKNGRSAESTGSKLSHGTDSGKPFSIRQSIGQFSN